MVSTRYFTPGSNPSRGRDEYVHSRLHTSDTFLDTLGSTSHRQERDRGTPPQEYEEDLDKVRDWQRV